MTTARTEAAPVAELITQSRESLSVAETSLRALVLDEYKASGTRKFPLGTEVKVYEKPKYDPARALEWCKGYLAAAVKTSLDTRMFESFAKSNPVPGLVEIVKEPRALLPTKIELEEKAAPAPAAEPPGGA
jgi:hypothetical protein